MINFIEENIRLNFVNDREIQIFIIINILLINIIVFIYDTAGTSALWQLLQHHPQIRPVNKLPTDPYPITKEIYYFSHLKQYMQACRNLCGVIHKSSQYTFH